LWAQTRASPATRASPTAKRLRECRRGHWRFVRFFLENERAGIATYSRPFESNGLPWIQWHRTTFAEYRARRRIPVQTARPQSATPNSTMDDGSGTAAAAMIESA
jgi:hypothetical protein